MRMAGATLLERASVRAPWRLAIALVFAGCGTTVGTEGPLGEPLVRGPVESIDHRATASGIVVRAAEGSAEMCGIAATAGAETRYYRLMPDGTRASAAVGDLQIGDTVEVFVEGPIAESCPVQGRASAIVILGG